MLEECKVSDRVGSSKENVRRTVRSLLEEIPKYSI